MAFKRWQKSPSKKGIQKAWSDLEMKVIGWCLNHGIKISATPDWKDEHGVWHAGTPGTCSSAYDVDPAYLPMS